MRRVKLNYCITGELPSGCSHSSPLSRREAHALIKVHGSTDRYGKQQVERGWPHGGAVNGSLHYPLSTVSSSRLFGGYKYKEVRVSVYAHR